MARRGLSTLSTLRIFTTEIALDLHKDRTKNSLDTPEETKMSHLGKKNSTRGNGNVQMFTHSIPIESRETPTTIRSRMLKELRQKEPLCMNAPYTVICRSDAEY